MAGCCCCATAAKMVAAGSHAPPVPVPVPVSDLVRQRVQDIRWCCERIASSMAGSTGTLSQHRPKRVIRARAPVQACLQGAQVRRREGSAAADEPRLSAITLRPVSRFAHPHRWSRRWDRCNLALRPISSTCCDAARRLAVVNGEMSSHVGTSFQSLVAARAKEHCHMRLHRLAGPHEGAR